MRPGELVAALVGNAVALRVVSVGVATGLALPGAAASRHGIRLGRAAAVREAGPDPGRRSRTAGPIRSVVSRPDAPRVLGIRTGGGPVTPRIFCGIFFSRSQPDRRAWRRHALQERTGAVGGGPQ